MDDNLIPLFGMLCVFGFPIGALIVSRVLAHRERMEMIRHGIVPPLGKRNAARYDLDPPNVAGAMSPQPAEASRLLRRGIKLAFIGMALTIGLSFIGYHPGAGNEEQFNFGPWLLGGLIPLFIGLSQVTIAFLTDPQIFARFRGAPPPPSGSPGPYYESPRQGPGPSAGTDQSYTYRPGDAQELRPRRRLRRAGLRKRRAERL